MPDGSRTSVCFWTGASGRKYEYQYFPIGTELKAEAGNYIFAKISAEGLWVPIYIGTTENLDERFENHHAMPCIKRNGATHVHAHLNHAGAKARIDEETDLRRNYPTTCNKQ